jgi:hypothetical protein
VKVKTASQNYFNCLAFTLQRHYAAKRRTNVSFNGLCCSTKVEPGRIETDIKKEGKRG